MKVQIEYDITDCRDCPFRHFHVGQGECWSECSHNDHNQKWYDAILYGCQESFTKIPDWCPLPLPR